MMTVKQFSGLLGTSQSVLLAGSNITAITNVPFKGWDVPLRDRALPSVQEALDLSPAPQTVIKFKNKTFKS